MKIVRTIADARRAVRTLGARLHRGRIAFVPTMGALHEGHATLFRAAAKHDQIVVASIFVNPTQFDDPADLAAYPRQEEQDAALAAACGVQLMFAPSAQEMYPAGHATTVTMAGSALGFEADHRPGHFDGVATVCLKLFSIVQPDLVYLGQKDAQQVAVLRQLVRDLNVPVEIAVVPTVREQDGLALSSRNARLSAKEKSVALAIPRALRAALDAHRRHADPVQAARAELNDLDVEYVAIARFDAAPTLVIAARAGRTRLIDNVPLDRPELAGLA